jgi:hypothetical protein
VDNLVIFEVLEVSEIGFDDRIGWIEIEHRMYES